MSSDLALHAARSESWELIDELMASCETLKPAYIAETVLSVHKSVESMTGRPSIVSDEDVRVVLGALGAGKISKEAVLEILAKGVPARQCISQFYVLSDVALRRTLEGIVKRHAGMPFKALIGVAMKELRGKASGEKIARMLGELAKG